MIIGLALSPDENLLATCGVMESTVRVWDVTTFKQVAVLGTDISYPNTAFSPDGTRLAVTDFGCTHVFRVGDYQEVLRLESPRSQQASVRFSKDGTYMLTVMADYGAFIWDAQTGKQLKRFPAGPPVWEMGHDIFTSPLPDRFPPQSWYGDLSPDSTKVVLCSQDGARVWDIKTGQLLYYLNALDGNMVGYLGGGDFGNAVGACDAHFSPDGRYLVVVGGGEALWIVEVASWKRVARYHPGLFNLPAFQGYFTKAAWSPDSRYVATANTESEIYVLNVDALIKGRK